jgi:carboxyl-terminal processing protease
MLEPGPNKVPTSAAPGPIEADRDENWLMEALEAVEANALYASRVDWRAQQVDAREFAATGPGPAALGAYVTVVLNKLGDGHSRLLHPTVASQTLDPAQMNPVPVGHLLEDRVGYLRLPGFSGGAHRQGDRVRIDKTPSYVSYVDTAHGHLATPARCGWVIDLRGNDGGNVFPMLSAVGPLLGAGTFLAFQHRDDRLEGVSIDHDGNATDLTTDGVELGALSNAPQPNATVPVAVITDSSTASAAEMVAIAFVGREETRSFGSPTAGVPTENHGVFLSDGSIVLIASAVSVDRNGETYDGPIAPDELTTKESSVDAPLAAAVDWLTSNEACR